MNETPRDDKTPRRCPQCGSELAPGVPPEFCPKCLLSAAITQPHAQTVAVAPPPIPNAIIQGQTFGHYLVQRPLGSGGMGAVFEAEDLDSGRRVALKVLSHRLDSPESRERFFREGRLAASVNHPNSVYIFGTEEIGGTPVISMEMLSGGTLQDRIRNRGPMSPGEAVDAVLQIIAGLEAAHAAGILHRDVKPSNCFLNQDGTVKIGDFGLSISTAVRTEPALTADGAFLGTPAFCPPEQLRGEELNARSDIYSVGATLFYMLTGRTPFEANNVVALIATVLERDAPSTRAIRPEVPQGLDRVLQRCLHKHRGERYGSYAELRRALEPFSSVLPAAAPLPQRLLAGALDMIIFAASMQAILLVVCGGTMNLLEILTAPGPRGFLLMIAGLTVSFLYYAISEWRFGATLGKRLAGLQVGTMNGQLPRFSQTALRAFMYVILPLIPFWTISITLSQNPGGFFNNGGIGAILPNTTGPWFYALTCTPYFVIALLFATARRHNGYRALHDLASGTRVVFRRKVPVRSGSPAKAVSGTAVPTGKTVGPYQVLEELGGDWLLGYDLRLLRRVWIRQMPAGSESFPASLRNLGRPGRLRWLTGKRSERANWDAFEAPTGHPFIFVAQDPQPWEKVRFWIWDLAQELIAARRDGTLPEVLSLNRIWITDDGKPKLLPFPAPGTQNEPETVLSESDFIARFTSTALNGNGQAISYRIRRPLPIYTKSFVDQIRGFASPEALLEQLSPLLQRIPSVTPLRRAMITLGCAAFPLLTLITSFLGTGFIGDFEKRHPDLMELNQVLSMRQGMTFVPAQARVPDSDFALFIAAHYRGFITDTDEWNSPLVRSIIKGEARAFAERSVAANPNPEKEQIQRVEKRIKVSNFEDVQRQMGQMSLSQVVFTTTLLIYVCIPALIAAVAFRGGLVLLLARVGFVLSDGSPAGRLRVFGRAVLAWLPALLALFLVFGGMSSHQPWVGMIGILILVTLAVISVLLPERGIQDRLLGTYPVPK